MCLLTWVHTYCARRPEYRVPSHAVAVTDGPSSVWRVGLTVGSRQLHLQQVASRMAPFFFHLSRIPTTLDVPSHVDLTFTFPFHYQQ